MQLSVNKYMVRIKYFHEGHFLLRMLTRDIIFLISIFDRLLPDAKYKTDFNLVTSLNVDHFLENT